MNQHSEASQSVVWLWRVAVVCKKEFVQFFRNWVLALFLLYTFTWMTYNTAISISKELKNAGLVVIDNDRSAASRELLYRFHEPQFREQIEFGVHLGVYP